MGHRAVIADCKGNGAITIETNLVVLPQDGNEAQVIGGRAIEHLANAVTAVTIHLDIGGIGESHLGQLVIGDFIHTTLGDSDFHPLASGKFGSGRIDGSVESIGIAGREDRQDRQASKLKFCQFAHIIFDFS